MAVVHLADPGLQRLQSGAGRDDALSGVAQFGRIQSKMFIMGGLSNRPNLLQLTGELVDSLE